MAGTPSATLILAYLRRLARDPSVLRLEPEDIKLTNQGHSRHMPKGKAKAAESATALCGCSKFGAWPLCGLKHVSKLSEPIIKACAKQ